MRVYSLLLLLLVVSCAFCKETRSKDPYVYQLTEELNDYYERQNSKSAENREKYPEGHEEYARAESFPLWVRIFDVANVEEHAFEHYNVKLNQLGVVFIVSQENDIQQVRNSISLRDVVRPSDKLNQAQCCHGIESIVHGDQPTINGANNFLGYNCFNVNAGSQIWTFCSEKEEEVIEFREVLREQAITNYFQEHASVEPNFIHDNSNYPLDEEWSYREQTQWPNTCHGKYQSPIAINSGKAVTVQEEDIEFRYTSSPANIEFDGHQTNVYGDFGKFTHVSFRGEVAYEAYKVVFKFPAEHIVDGQKHEGEMQIHHQNVEGVEAIVSVFLDSGDISLSDKDFLEEISPETWETFNDFAQQVESANLNNLVVRNFFRKQVNRSFFHYKGSLSAPPCTEGVEHFVLKNAVSVSAAVLNILRNKSFKASEETNSRDLQNFHDVVFYWQDGSSHCEPKLPDSILPIIKTYVKNQRLAEVTEHSEELEEDEEEQAEEEQAEEEQAEGEQAEGEQAEEQQEETGEELPSLVEDVVEEVAEEQQEELDEEEEDELNLPGRFVKATTTFDELEYNVNREQETEEGDVDLDSIPDDVKRRVHAVKKATGLFAVQPKAVAPQPQVVETTEEEAAPEEEEEQGVAAPEEEQEDAAPEEEGAAEGEEQADAEEQAGEEEAAGEETAEEETPAEAESKKKNKHFRRL